MTYFIEPFRSNPFLLRALIAGNLVAISCGIIGSFTVLRGLAFIGDALGHGVLPGIAVAILLGIPGIVGAAAGAVVMIAGIGWITRRSSLSSDTAIGLLFVAMLALGVVIVSRSDSFSGDIVQVLFGEVLGVSNQTIWIQLAATLLIAGAAAVCARPFLLLCVNPELAQVSGFSARRYHLIMLALIAVAVVTSFQTVGTMLVFGMLIAPAGASALFAHRIEQLMAGAALIGSVSVYTGLLLSYHYDLAAGACIVLVAITIFFAFFFVKNVVLKSSQNSNVLI
jgi:ABC-type Mn2+/Zn2+ transport system permease subunit